MVKKIKMFYLFFVTLIFGFVMFGNNTLANPAPIKLEGEMLKSKMVFTKNNRVITNYNAPLKNFKDSRGRQEEAYFYPLTTAQRDQTGSAYLEDRLDLSQDFEMIGFVEFAGGSSPPADGMGLVFHKDDTKKTGKPGENLGIGGLSNAIGLAVDIYTNTNDPADFYTQIWNTNQAGTVKRSDKYQAMRNPLNKRGNRVKMKYTANGNSANNRRLLEIQVDFAEQTNTHIVQVPESFDYVYFSTSAATGESYAGQNFYIKELTYVPYRTRKIMYRDENLKEITVPNNTEILGYVGDAFELTPVIPEGYELVNVQGDLKGVYSFEEKTKDKNIFVNLAKKKSNNTLNIQEKDILRDKKQMKISPSDNRNVVTSVTNTTSITGSEKIKSIAIKTPKGVKPLDPTFPNGIDGGNWKRVQQITDSELITQFVLTNVDGIGSSPDSMTSVQVSNLIKNLQFTVEDNVKDETLDKKKIIVDVSTRAFARYENKEFTKYYEVVNNNIVPDLSALNTERHALDSAQASFKASFFYYRGLKGQLAETQDNNEKKFLDGLVTDAQDGAWVDNDQVVPSGVIGNLDNISRYVVQYKQPNNMVLSGPDDTLGIKEAKVPQPVRGQQINKLTNEVISNNEYFYESTKPYRIDQVIYSSAASIPSIPKYNYIGLDDGRTFPIKHTDEAYVFRVLYKHDGPLATTHYLKLDNKGKETVIPVFENVGYPGEQPIRKKVSYNDTGVPGQPIIGVSPELSFIGYNIDKTKTKIVLDSNKTEIKDGKIPLTDFTVYYYYNPRENITVPDSLSFGDDRSGGHENEMYGVEESNRSHVNVINTSEGNGWNLMASTTGLISDIDGTTLVADIFYKENEKVKPITYDTRPLIEKKSELTASLPMSSEDEKDGLFVKVKQENKKGQYKGQIKFSLQNAP